MPNGHYLDMMYLGPKKSGGLQPMDLLSAYLEFASATEGDNDDPSARTSADTGTRNIHYTKSVARKQI
jgi:hypothetical protein